MYFRLFLASQKNMLWINIKFCSFCITHGRVSTLEKLTTVTANGNESSVRDTFCSVAAVTHTQNSTKNARLDHDIINTLGSKWVLDSINIVA